MKERKLKLLVVCIVVGCFVTAGPAFANKEFLLDSLGDWNDVLSGGSIYGLDPSAAAEYQSQWELYTEEGNSYPNDTIFLSPELYVYGGGGSWIDPCTAEEYNYPNDVGLVMTWGDACTPAGSYWGAFMYDYGVDPDLRNCTITVSVRAPSWVTQVSLGLQNPPLVGGPIRSWNWNCGPGQPIPWGILTTITIDLSKTGMAAATPTASGYANNLLFSLATVQWIIVDENAQWVPGSPQNVPPPGGSIPGMWNYWYNLVVSANPPPASVPGKLYLKWSQPPKPIDPNGDPPIFLGWDELSDYNNWPIVADDWRCEDDRPVTDIHWWGSFIGWDLPLPPPILPKKFHIGIWNDIPDPNPGDPSVFSHPDEMVWENYCDNWVWNFAGYDESPRDPNEKDTCFQFTQLLSQDEWFWQDPCDPCDPNGRVYWLSIAAIYDQNDYTDPEFYPWGWKTRPHFFNDDAVQITDLDIAPPVIGSHWTGGNPIFWPDPNISWDVAFELTTNKPAYCDNPIPGDLNCDKIVNLFDLDIMAGHWLETWP